MILIVLLILGASADTQRIMSKITIGSMSTKKNAGNTHGAPGV
jgi:hypothetical protein